MATSEDLHSSANLQLHTPKGSIVPHILLWAMQPAALSSPSFKDRRTASALIIVVLAIASQINPHFTNNIALAQPFTIGWSVYLATLEKILFAADPGPEASFWHIDKPVREALGYAAFGYQKLRWAIALMFNMRGIRWNHEVKNIRRTTTSSRSRFLVTQALNLLYYGLAADLFVQLGIRWFYTAPNGEVGDLNSKYLTLRHPDWRWSFAKAYAFGATPYFICCMQYTLFSILAVLLGLSKPEDWPPLFGRLKEATTVRVFWGKYWHQTVRRSLTSYTGAFVDRLGIKRGTNLSSYTQLWLAFTISGCMHANSMLGLPCPLNITVTDRTVGMLQFFLWQAFAITLEDFTIWFCKYIFEGLGSTHFRTVIGWLWVTGTLWYSMSMAGDVMLRMRLMEETFLSGTVIGGLIQEWVPIPP